MYLFFPKNVFFHAQAGYFYLPGEIRLKIFFCAFLDYRVHVHVFQLNKPDVTMQEMNYQVELHGVFNVFRCARSSMALPISIIRMLTFC